MKHLDIWTCVQIQMNQDLQINICVQMKGMIHKMELHSIYIETSSKNENIWSTFNSKTITFTNVQSNGRRRVRIILIETKDSLNELFSSTPILIWKKSNISILWHFLIYNLQFYFSRIVPNLDTPLRICIWWSQTLSVIFAVFIKPYLIK